VIPIRLFLCDATALPDLLVRCGGAGVRSGSKGRGLNEDVLRGDESASRSAFERAFLSASIATGKAQAKLVDAPIFPLLAGSNVLPVVNAANSVVKEQFFSVRVLEQEELAGVFGDVPKNW